MCQRTTNLAELKFSPHHCYKSLFYYDITKNVPMVCFCNFLFIKVKTSLPILFFHLFLISSHLFPIHWHLFWNPVFCLPYSKKQQFIQIVLFLNFILIFMFFNQVDDIFLGQLILFHNRFHGQIWIFHPFIRTPDKEKPIVLRSTFLFSKEMNISENSFISLIARYSTSLFKWLLSCSPIIFKRNLSSEIVMNLINLIFHEATIATHTWYM